MNEIDRRYAIIFPVIGEIDPIFFDQRPNEFYSPIGMPGNNEFNERPPFDSFPPPPPPHHEMGRPQFENYPPPPPPHEMRPKFDTFPSPP